jgi:hypothetical protein
MSQPSTVAWLSLGVLFGLLSAGLMMQKVPPSLAEFGQWSLLSTVWITSLLLSAFAPLHPEFHWLRNLGPLLAVSAWVTLVAAYPLWGFGDADDLRWGFSVYLMLGGVVAEYYRQLRRGREKQSLLAESNLLPTLTALIAIAHTLTEWGRMPWSSQMLLLSMICTPFFFILGQRADMAHE